jgi:hypothetical protein
MFGNEDIILRVAGGVYDGAGTSTVRPAVSNADLTMLPRASFDEVARRGS